MKSVDAYNGSSLFEHERAVISEIIGVVGNYNARLLNNILLYDNQTHNYYEYDVIIVSRSGIYILELKHWTGKIIVGPYNWIVNENYRPDPHKSNSFKCKLLKGIYQHKFKTYPDIWIPSFVVLTNPNSIIEGADAPNMITVNLAKKTITFESLADFLTFFKKRESSNTNYIFDRSQVEGIANYFSSLNVPRQSIKYSVPGYEVLEYLSQKPECLEFVARPIVGHLRGLNRFRVFRIPYQISEEEKRRYLKKAYNSLNAVALIGDHPHIHKVWVVENENGDIIEGSDWSESGTLRDFINEKKGQGNTELLIGICRSITSALISAHKVNVIHRAVRPENILMMNEVPKLMNFDLSYQIEEGQHITVISDVTKLKDDGYTAPEVLQEKDIDEGTDFFSLGVIAFELFTGNKPFSSVREFIAQGGILSEKLRIKLEEARLPRKTIDAIVNLIVVDRKKRLKNTDEILSAFSDDIDMHSNTEAFAINPILEQGSMYDVYEIIELIGKGAEAQVYKARTIKGEYVALKLFNKEVPVERIIKESEILSKVKSAYVVGSNNKVGYWNNERFFIVMDFIEGESLRVKIDRGERPNLDKFKSISICLINAIEAFHRNGDNEGNMLTFLHSDIKPDNILITSDGKPVLIDCGVAGEPRVDVFQGTVGYIPPDSIKGLEMQFSEDGDLFAFGVTLWEWVYGKRPYENPAIGDVPEKIEGVLPPKVQECLIKLVATQASERFLNIEEMKEAFLHSFDIITQDIEAKESKDWVVACEEIEGNVIQGVHIDNSKDTNVDNHSNIECSENNFVTYLNSLSCSSAANSNATAESQICNPFFESLFVKNPLADFIFNKIAKDNSNIILTGNAGDGKTTIAADIFFRLTGTKRRLMKKEYIEARKLVIIKDMSELTKAERKEILEEAYNQNDKQYLIVSNTGTLLESFASLQIEDIRSTDIESDLLGALEADSPTELLNNKFWVLNIARTDSIETACNVFLNMLDSENWSNCECCTNRDKCPIYINVCLLQEKLDLVSNRIKLLYKRLYEYGMRLTMRQMTGHLAYSITAGRDCREIGLMSYTALHEELLGSLFYNRFFGDDGEREIPEAWQLVPVERIRSTEIGVSVDPYFERKVWAKTETEIQFTGKAAQLFNKMKTKTEQPEASIRRQVRRLLYFFAPLSDESGKRYLSNFLGSPMLLDYMDTSSGTELIPAQRESKYRYKILQVLQEYFSGIRLPEGGWEIRDLYITLNRREFSSTTQIILANFRADDFEVIIRKRYDTPNSNFKQLCLVSKQGNAEMILDLPFLDYVARRYEGEVAEDLGAYYADRLERFKVKLLDIYQKNMKKEDKLLQLLRIDTGRTFKLMKISITDEKMEVL